MAQNDIFVKPFYFFMINIFRLCTYDGKCPYVRAITLENVYTV